MLDTTMSNTKIPWFIAVIVGLEEYTVKDTESKKSYKVKSIKSSWKKKTRKYREQVAGRSRKWIIIVFVVSASLQSNTTDKFILIYFYLIPLI